ncbi:MAG TPA: NAD-dependent epimerase/dehydratase family protein [Anaeromyxobacteraceae bacterium]|nr:NAD-dependent epimerase/dehydratase family protein [Anaeromyxobacteraceae bacterium]
MRALVTGANGFLGRALVRVLLERGYAVRALVRPRRSPGELAALGAEEVAGDVTRPETLPAAVVGADLVFHLAGIRRAPRRDDFLRVNADGTRHLVEACLQHAPSLRRFVLAGSLAASGPSAEGRREEDPLSPVEWYGESKAEAERIALSHPGRLRASVARPPRITGPGDRENLLFFRLAARRILVAISGPPRPLSFVDVDDCARGMLLLAEREEAIGEAFFLAHESRTDLEGLQREVLGALGVEPVRLRIPPLLLRMAGSAADVASRVLDRHLPFNRKLAEQILAPGWTCRTDKAARILGFEARIDLAESIRRSTRWYRERGWI